MVPCDEVLSWMFFHFILRWKFVVKTNSQKCLKGIMECTAFALVHATLCVASLSRNNFVAWILMCANLVLTPHSALAASVTKELWWVLSSNLCSVQYFSCTEKNERARERIKKSSSPTDLPHSAKVWCQEQSRDFLVVWCPGVKWVYTCLSCMRSLNQGESP